DAWRRIARVIRLVGPEIVRGQQPGERGFLLRPLIAERIDVIDGSPGGWLRLLARTHRHDSRVFAVYAVGIGQHEAALVLRAGLEVEDAAGEHVRGDVLVGVPYRVSGASANDFVLQAQQGQRIAPLLFALLAIGDGNAGIAIVIAGNPPLEAERHERG